MPMTAYRRIAIVAILLSGVFFSARLVSQERAEPRPDQKSLRVIVDANGQIKINGETVERASLKTRLQDLLKGMTEKTAVVIAAPAIPFSAVARVIDIVRDAGFTKVGLLMGEPVR
jgi:biopolymer transport protein ExbD